VLVQIRGTGRATGTACTGRMPTVGGQGAGVTRARPKWATLAAAGVWDSVARESCGQPVVGGFLIDPTGVAIVQQEAQTRRCVGGSERGLKNQLEGSSKSGGGEGASEASILAAVRPGCGQVGKAPPVVSCEVAWWIVTGWARIAQIT